MHDLDYLLCRLAGSGILQKLKLCVADAGGREAAGCAAFSSQQGEVFVLNAGCINKLNQQGRINREPLNTGNN